MIELSIVVVSYRNPSLLQLFLRTLARAIPSDLSSEVIVVDSASSPETRNVVNHDAAGLIDRLELIPRKENTGYTKGVNLGLSRSRGAFILNLNPDTILTPDSITSMMTYMRENKDVGLIGPRLLNMDGSRQYSCFRFYTPYTMVARRLSWLPRASDIVNRFLMEDGELEKPCDVDWLMGSAFMARQEAIDKVGLLDERFFHYCSDDDWARRFWRSGWRVVYYPSALIYHWHARDSKGRHGILDVLLRRQARWHVADALRYFRKHGLNTVRPAPTC